MFSSFLYTNPSSPFLSYYQTPVFPIPHPFTFWRWQYLLIWNTKLRQDQAPALCIQVDEGIPPQLLSSKKPIIAPKISPGPIVRGPTNSLSHTTVTHIQKASFAPCKLHICQSRFLELPRISKFIWRLSPLNLSGPAKIRYSKQKSYPYNLRVNKFTHLPYLYMFLGEEAEKESGFLLIP